MARHDELSDLIGLEWTGAGECTQRSTRPTGFFVKRYAPPSRMRSDVNGSLHGCQLCFGMSPIMPGVPGLICASAVAEGRWNKEGQDGTRHAVSIVCPTSPPLSSARASSILFCDIVLDLQQTRIARAETLHQETDGVGGEGWHHRDPKRTTAQVLNIMDCTSPRLELAQGFRAYSR